MKIRIIKCDEPDAWYANEIGNEYEVTTERKDCYYVDDARFVLKEDAEVIEGGE